MSARGHRTGWRAAAVAAAVAAVALVGEARAHDLAFTEVLLVLRSDGAFVADVTCDLDALALGASPDADDRRLAEILGEMDAAERIERLDRLRGMLARRLRVRFDGEPAAFSVSFPEVGLPPAAGATPSYLGVTARLSGRFTPESEEATFMASRAFPPVVLTVLDEAALAGVRMPLERGEESPAYRLGSGAAGVDLLTNVGRYLVLGFWHIVPTGLDHVLFVLGLFLLTPRWRPLLAQVSAFTVAHTITLGLATLGVVSLPSAVVEPLIALSIVWVAVENLLTRELGLWRVGLVFAFGLLHGLGFAGVLAEVGLPAGELAAALVSFNVGVELGQLAVLLGAFLLVRPFVGRPWYRRRVVVPASVAIAGVGLFWAVQRLA